MPRFIVTRFLNTKAVTVVTAESQQDAIDQVNECGKWEGTEFEGEWDIRDVYLEDYEAGEIKSE